jgi:dCMP deaminase
MTKSDEKILDLIKNPPAPTDAMRDLFSKEDDLNRPGWDQYFMEFAKLTATRSMCLRRSVGAVLVKDRMVLSTGYNGPPKGKEHCRHPDSGGQFFPVCVRMRDDTPSGMQQQHCHGLHAEQNAIIQAAYFGVSIKDSILYCTTYPCSICMKMLINAGIKQIFYSGEYNAELSVDLAKECDIIVKRLGG